MSDKLNEMIKDLSPELQEKARACKTMEEFNEFAADNDLELSDDALETIAGGGACSGYCVDGQDHRWELISHKHEEEIYRCTVCKERKTVSRIIELY